MVSDTSPVGWTPDEARMFHVSSIANRGSITRHGLDWSRMGAARGIAGSRGPEVAGVFLCTDEFQVDFFLRINNTGGPVDVWSVRFDTPPDLETSPEGFCYLPQRVPPEMLTLPCQAVPPESTYD
ncbi:hypothetical protein ACG83_14630 [Frankia sp. R43]|nr:hypothetical protein ACG83_14630 [Frankia sp. R43]